MNDHPITMSAHGKIRNEGLTVVYTPPHGQKHEIEYVGFQHLRNTTHCVVGMRVSFDL